jgi:hypothetical protein
MLEVFPDRDGHDWPECNVPLFDPHFSLRHPGPALRLMYVRITSYSLYFQVTRLPTKHSSVYRRYLASWALIPCA